MSENVGARDPSPNVYGIETEYTYLLTLPGGVEHELVGRCHSVDRRLGLNVTPSESSTDFVTNSLLRNSLYDIGIVLGGKGMLSNGARIWTDPSGLEYATAETSSAEEAVLRSYDGDEIMLRLFQQWRDQGVI